MVACVLSSPGKSAAPPRRHRSRSNHPRHRARANGTPPPHRVPATTADTPRTTARESSATWAGTTRSRSPPKDTMRSVKPPWVFRACSSSRLSEARRGSRSRFRHQGRGPFFDYSMFKPRAITQTTSSDPPPSSARENASSKAPGRCPACPPCDIPARIAARSGRQICPVLQSGC